MAENVNVLYGMRCPACGGNGRFAISVTAVVSFTDDGGEDAGGFEWDNESQVWCENQLVDVGMPCDWEGTVWETEDADAEFKERAEK